jgi:DDE family transposase
MIDWRRGRNCASSQEERRSACNHLYQGFSVYPKVPKEGKRSHFLREERISQKSLRKREMTEMYLSIFDEGEQVGQGSLPIDAASLYCAFEQVKDGRKKKGKRYPLALILTLLMLGKMAGEKSINGIVDWVKERKAPLKRQLNWPKGFPVNSTYSAALAGCDGQEIAKVIAQVIVKARAVEQCGADPSRLLKGRQAEEKLIHTAMDGKTLRGTLGHAKEEQPKVASASPV